MSADNFQVSPTCTKPNVSRCNLLNGDCLELMAQIPAASIDMIFADLPYGTTNCDWDIKISFEKLWQHWNRVAKENAAIILTGNNLLQLILSTAIGKISGMK